MFKEICLSFLTFCLLANPVMAELSEEDQAILSELEFWQEFETWEDDDVWDVHEDEDFLKEENKGGTND